MKSALGRRMFQEMTTRYSLMGEEKARSGTDYSLNPLIPRNLARGSYLLTPILVGIDSTPRHIRATQTRARTRAITL